MNHHGTGTRRTRRFCDSAIFSISMRNGQGSGSHDTDGLGRSTFGVQGRNNGCPNIIFVHQVLRIAAQSPMSGIKKDSFTLCCMEPNTPPGLSPYTSPGRITHRCKIPGCTLNRHFGSTV